MGVSPNNTNQPTVLMVSGPGTVQRDVLYFINMFTPGAPPSSTFNVPPKCVPPTSVGQQFMKNADHPSLIMPPFMMDPTGEALKKMTDL